MECQASFCYLCLKPQENSQAAHAHAIDHSNDYWEMRPGYTERYHWLLARKELANVFKRKVEDPVRKAALNSHKAMLEEKNMWPMPAGLLKSDQWIQEVRNTPQSTRKYIELGGKNGKERIEKTEQIHTPKKKIELLQNEFIYLRQAGDSKNAAIIQAELQRLGAKVLASLDVRDEGGMACSTCEHIQQPGFPAIANAAQGVGAVAAAIQPIPGGEIIPVAHDDPRVPRPFAAIAPENMYQVGNLIWSGVPARRMNQRDAENYCAGLGGGARLPTRADYEALRRAMGHPNNYNRNRIPDMAGNWLWSSVNPNDPDFAYGFDGYNGTFGSYDRLNELAVRCVVGG